MKSAGFAAVLSIFLSLPVLAQTPPGPEKPGPNMPTDEGVEEPAANDKARAPKRPVVPPAPPMIFGERPHTDGVNLQALDKITAHVTPLTIALDQPVKFGTLIITARACNMRPPEEEPESAAFLEIDDQGRDGARTTAFSGWMFASSPALSALEHPVYDVWVKSCKIASGPNSSGPSSKR